MTGRPGSRRRKPDMGQSLQPGRTDRVGRVEAQDAARGRVGDDHRKHEAARLRAVEPQHPGIPGESRVVTPEQLGRHRLEIDHDVDRNGLGDLTDAEAAAPDERERDGAAGGVSASPTITTSESATPGAAMAATIALPGATLVTSPVLDTLATLGVRLFQVASE